MDSEKPKVIHVITDLGDGGAQAVLYRLCRNDDCFIHSVISLTDFGKYGSLLREAGVATDALGMLRGRISLCGVLKLFRLLHADRNVTVQTWMYHADLMGGVIARLAGCSTVVWNIRHTEITPGATGRLTQLVARACAWLSGVIPDRIIACAHRAKEVHVSIGYADEKFVIIPNGYALDRFIPDVTAGQHLRAKLGISKTAPVIGVVGRWNLQKDHDNFLAASASLRSSWPDVQILLVGNGCEPNNPRLVASIRHYGLEDAVHLLGSQDDIPAVMNALDLHVLSSSHGEGFPNVVAEAMACGIPCVVTDVGDAATIVGDTGWTVPPKDSAALSGAILIGLAARSDAAAWQNRGESARSRIERNFDLKRMVARYHAVWIGCANRHRAPMAE